MQVSRFPLRLFRLVAHRAYKEDDLTTPRPLAYILSGPREREHSVEHHVPSLRGRASRDGKKEGAPTMKNLMHAAILTATCAVTLAAQQPAPQPRQPGPPAGGPPAGEMRERMGPPE